MKFTRHLAKEDIKKLEFEVISTDLKVYLSRELEGRYSQGDNDIERKLFLINKAYNLRGLPTYMVDVNGDYLPEEQAWIASEFHLLFRRFNTVEFVEFLGDLIEGGQFSLSAINELLETDNLSFWYEVELIDQPKIVAKVNSIDQILEDEDYIEHVPNMRTLVHRMDSALADSDYAGVLHAASNIVETLAKHVVSIPTIQNNTLKQFFDRYRKDSNLPESILDYILQIYEDRNTTPIAGHGHLSPPNISKETAVTLSEMTKAFVRIETKLQPTAKIPHK